MTFDLKTYLTDKKRFIDDTMATRWLPPKTTDPTTLYESMHYSLFADGKRIRPILTLASADALGLSNRDVLPIGAALEMIHVFSLIHDDLPAMDNDDLRRGQPTNHRVYGEATAILAGDALLAQAFVPLSELDMQKFEPRNILRVIRMVAEATGAPGMVGGQVIDMQSEGKTIDLARLKTLHRLKTGALLKCAVVAPAILSGTPLSIEKSLTAYGEDIGLAFQIKDDILDIEGGDEIGKNIGSDIARGKVTFPALMGLENAKEAAKKALHRALSALSCFDEKADPLRALAHFIVERKT